MVPIWLPVRVHAQFLKTQNTRLCTFEILILLAGVGTVN